MKRKKRMIPVMLGILVGALLLGAMFVGCTDEITTVKVKSIAVSMLPTTTEYWSGEYLDPRGLVLSVAMSNGTTSLVPWSKSSGITLSPMADETLSGAGNKTIYVTYESKETSFEVYVENSSVASLAITTQPSDLDYDVNESFDPSGLVLQATMDDGTTRTLPWSDSSDDLTLYPASGTMFTESGTQYVKVLYQGVAASVSVDVYDVYSVGSQYVGSIQAAGYWKNGTFHQLGNGKEHTGGFDMTLDARGNVYVSGYQANDNGYNVAVYWKPDGTQVEVGSKIEGYSALYSYGYTIYMEDDGNMYMGGMQTGPDSVIQGGYWDLSTLEFTQVSSVKSKHSYILAMRGDSEGNLYKAGYQVNDALNGYVATYYTNDNTAVLLGTTVGSRINTMLEGDDGAMYFAGGNESTGTVGYWSSAVTPTGTDEYYKTLVSADEGYSAYLYCMAKDSEGNFYFSGNLRGNEYANQTAGYWKPDSDSATGYTFVALGDASVNSFGRNITLNDAGDIYVSGSNVNNRAGYWKNGTFVQLGSDRSNSSMNVTASQAVWRYKK